MPASSRLAKDRRLFIGIVVALCLLLIPEGILTRHEFLSGYLAAVAFWMQIVLGAIGITLIHNLTGGEWGVKIRPQLNQMRSTLPIMLILFIPIFLTLPDLYPWASHAVVASDPDVARRTGYMNPIFFTLRTVFYFAVWAWIAKKANADVLLAAVDPVAKARMRKWSGIGLLILFFTLGFAPADWLMTVDPKWSSDAFGVVYLVGCLSSGFAFAIFLAVVHGRGRFLKGEGKVLIDLGNLLLMSVLLWAYLNFAQYLVCWAGQMPAEIDYYHVRAHGGWAWIVTIVACAHFFLPFPALLFRRLKRTPWAMLVIVVIILLAEYLESLAIVAPSESIPLGPGKFGFLAALGVSGLVWLEAYAWRGYRSGDFAGPGEGAAV